MTVSNNPTIVKLDQSLIAAGEAIHEGNYDKAIAQTSGALQDLIVELQVTLLDKRSHARVMKGLLAEALVDAKKMMELAPKRSLGYLRAGDIYTRQENHAAANATYKRAMDKVSPWDAHYNDLSLLGKETEIRLQGVVGVDFVKLLPEAIVSNIFERVDVPGRLECIGASPLWKAHINQNANLWRSIYCLDKKASEIVSMLTPRIGVHVEELHMAIKSNEANQIYRGFIFSLHEGMFPRLTTLTIDDVSPDLFGTRHGENILSVIGRKLKHFSITYATDEDLTNVMQVASVLDLCPHLQHLKYAASRDFQSCLGNINLDKRHPLLSLDIDCSTINPRNLAPVLMKCARIRRLVVIGADLPTIDTINQYCSNLMLFGFDTPNIPHLTEEQCTARPNGLRMLRTQPYKIYGADIWMPLIKSHQRTLEHLSVKFHCDFKDPKKDVRKYKALRFQKLQSLASNFFVNTQELFLPAIKDLDTITELTITCSSNWQELVEVTLSLKNLRCLTITDTLKQKRDYSTELVQLFRGWHQSKDEGRSLEHVELRQCTFVADEVLLHLAAISTLKKIVLSNCVSHTAYGLQSFLKKLKEHKNITSVALVDIVALEDSSLRVLGEIERLRSIELKSCNRITNTGVQDMASAIAETRNSMEKLIVYKCPGVSWKGTQTILGAFPNYRFTSSSYKKSTIKNLAEH